MLPGLLFCFFFLLLQSASVVLRVTQIRELTGRFWQLARKVIRTATVSNSSECETLPASVGLDGKR